MSIVKRLGEALLLMPLFIYIISAFVFMVNWHITPFVFISALVLALLFCMRWNASKRLRICLVCLFLSIVGGACLLSCNIYDSSYDGQWYHSAIVKMISEGWNPFYNPILEMSDMPYYTDTHVWASHYAKGMETIEGAIVSLIGNLEAAKSLNLILVVGMFCLLLDLFRDILPCSFYLRTILAIVVTLNPIVINQVFTHYIDFTCYICIVCGAICIYNVLIRKDCTDFYILALMALFVPSIKFNIAFWFIFILGFFFGAVCLWLKKIEKKVVFVVGISFSLGFAFAFNPYVTNSLSKHNPLYPLIGKDKVDIMSIVTPEKILGKSSFYQVNYSIASNPYSNDSRRNGGSNILRVSKYDILDSPAQDLQLGGFGIFFFEALILLVFSYMTLERNKFWYFCFGFCLFLYACLFILPTSFLFRYVPFFYLVPCIMLFYIFRDGKSIQRKVAGLAVSLLLLDSFISMVGVTFMNVQQYLQTNYIINEIKTKDRPVYIKCESVQFFDKLESSGISFYDNRESRKYSDQLTKINLIGADVDCSILPSEFADPDKPWLMRKIPFFNLKFE